MPAVTASVLAIFGPTGSGKSDLALALARNLDGEVVNADSIQVYSDLTHLSARPDAANCAVAPHRLYGHIDGAHRHSAASWAQSAAAAVEEVIAAGRLPILVGGTGFYFSALFDGIAGIPEVPDLLRVELDLLYAAIGGERFRAELERYDPVLAARLPPGDRQRLVRGLAVARASGRSLSDWQAAPARPLLARPAAGVILQPPRAALYARCDERLRRMLTAGALDEVRILLARDLSPSLPVMKAVGVPHFAALLRGQVDATTALAAAQRDTRRYAKRQLTWARHRGIAQSLLATLALPSAPWHEGWATQAAELEAFLRRTLRRCA